MVYQLCRKCTDAGKITNWFNPPLCANCGSPVERLEAQEIDRKLAEASKDYLLKYVPDLCNCEQSLALQAELVEAYAEIKRKNALLEDVGRVLNSLKKELAV